MKKTGCILIWIMLPALCFAQFTQQGIVTFERKTSLRRMLQTEDGNEWVKKYIDQLPQFITSTFSLSFSGATSNYKFESDEELKGMASWISGNSLANKNQVWSNLETGQSIAQKQVYEKKFLITDSISRFQWKIEDEIRTIAGYTCRKAITTICDSVVVVAFYTPQIVPTGGPESFNGLPGMILGIAIPRLYTTWFATQVELTTPEDLEPPKKGEKVNKISFREEIKKAVKDWDKTGSRVIWQTTL
jgi:GLPGLI family protein